MYGENKIKKTLEIMNKNSNEILQTPEKTREFLNKVLGVIDDDANASTEDIKDWAARLSRDTIAAGESEYE